MSKRGLKPQNAKNKFFPKGRQVEQHAINIISALLEDNSLEKDQLIENLHLIQDKFNAISKDHMVALAYLMKLSLAEVHEVATFYHHFNVIEDSESKYSLTVRVCEGISCEMANSKNLFKQLDGESYPHVQVKFAPCVGACDKAPIVVVGKNQIQNADLNTAKTAIEEKQTMPVKPNYRNFSDYIRRGGYKQWKKCLAGAIDKKEVIEIIETAGLRGLGGAGFPTARKWKFLENTPKPRVLAINADEGEPGTFKDRFILDTNPHRMLEGILIAAWAVEADSVYIYLRDEYYQAREVLLSELSFLQSAKLHEQISIYLRRGAGAYICGEESAMLESIEGKRGLPRNRPPFPAQSGLFGRPTLINNVETTYWIPEILEKGADWYQKKGRPHFFSVSGRVRSPGIKLAPAGITAQELIFDHSDGMLEGHEFTAFLPGGASGGLLPASKSDLPLDFGSLDDVGCFIGSSAVVVFSQFDTIPSICRNLVHFFEDESCGQCTPCRLGCEKMSQLIRRDSWDINLIKELSLTMQDASICGLGQAAPNPVLSAIRFFPESIK